MTKEDIRQIVRKNLRRVKTQLLDRDILENLEFASDYGFDLVDMIEFSWYCSQDLGVEMTHDELELMTVGELVSVLYDRCRRSEVQMSA